MIAITTTIIFLLLLLLFRLILLVKQYKNQLEASEIQPVNSLKNSSKSKSILLNKFKSNDGRYLKDELYYLIKEDSSIFEFLENVSLDGIWYWDLEYPEYEWMSNRFWQVLGYDPDEKKHLSSEWQNIIDPEDLESAKVNFIAHCNDPSHPYDQIVRYRHKNDSIVWVRCRGIAIRDKQGKPIRMLGAHNDITQIKQAQEKLFAVAENLRKINQQLIEEIDRRTKAEAAAQKALQSAKMANKLKSNFLSSTSHELRTPLSSVLNYLTLLKNGFYDDEAELREYIEAAYIGTFNLIDIINDVLDLAKIEAGRMEIELKSLKLDPLLQELYNLFKPQTIRSDIDFKIDCEVEEIVADPIKVKQVLTNLLCNSFKFTHTGQVYLRVNRDNITKSQIIFSVIDTGIGIESNDFDHLFDPFIQEDNSIRRSYGGTGLGLSICKKLVELMNGKIWLFSQGKNKGTTVSFSLPIRD